MSAHGTVFRSWMNDVRCGDFTFRVVDLSGSVYLQACRMERDSFSGVLTEQKGRKWPLSQYMTKSEVVQTALKAVLTYLEHEARESFTYKGERIFGPHFDVEALVTLAQQKALDYRRAPCRMQEARTSSLETAWCTSPCAGARSRWGAFAS